MDESDLVLKLSYYAYLKGFEKCKKQPLGVLGNKNPFIFCFV